jgi:ribosomal protein S21
MEESDHKRPFRREDRTGNYAHSDRAPRVPREREFKGYYVDVTKSGGDAIRAFRKLKRMYKDTKFFEEMRERECYIKPSARKREAQKERRKVLRRLQRERDDSRLMGQRRK